MIWRMIAEKSQNVKGWAKAKARCLDFMDSHPRTGWFLVTLMFLDVVLNLLDLFH